MVHIRKFNLSALNNIIFETTDAERIIVQPEKENHASCNTLLAAGYVYDEENELYIVTKDDFYKLG